MADRDFQCAVHPAIWLLLMAVACPRDVQTLSLHASDLVILETSATNLTCTTTSSQGRDGMKWFKDGEELVSTGRYPVFQEGDGASTVLVISDATVGDSGVFACRLGEEASSVTLLVLPRTWLPVCERSPGSGRLGVGDTFSISCASAGHPNTSLKWYQANSPIILPLPPSSAPSTEASVTVNYRGTVQEAGSLFFLCEARLGDFSRNCHVKVNDEPPVSVVPFVVVGLMTLIALLLFFLVLFILFRHRQCRFCREPMLEPRQVLDPESLQSGSWIPPPVVAIDPGDGEDGPGKDGPRAYTNPDFHSQPPDVVPAQEPRPAAAAAAAESDTSRSKEHQDGPPASTSAESSDAPSASSSGAPRVALPAESETSGKAKSKTKNHTLTKNMDQNFDKPIQTLEKNTLPSRKSRARAKGDQKDRKKVKHYKEPPVKARMKTPKEPIYAQVKKLNVPKKSEPGADAARSRPSAAAAAGVDGADPGPSARAPRAQPRPAQSNGDARETSSTATGETDSTGRSASLQQVNDLGGGGSRRKPARHYRKKSEGSRRNSDQDEGGGLNLNIKGERSEPGGSSVPSSSSSSASSSSGGGRRKARDKVPADRVIYAELDFTRKVGLNITE